MRIFTLCLIIALSAIQSLAYAKAPVWKVSKGDQTLYIGGTIHLLSKKDYPLPQAFDQAFDLAEAVIFETNIDVANSITAQMKLLPVMVYQDGRTIKSVLKPETYQELMAFLEQRGMPAALFEKFTPAGMSLSLILFELQSMGITGQSGVETFYNTKAKYQNKEISWLESFDEQVQFISRMNELDADMMISTTLRDIKELKHDWPKLLNAWRSGNTEQLEQLGIERMLADAPELYQYMLVERNRGWISEIKHILDTPEIEFVLVGALHLAGKDSVLKMLSDEGYQIEQLD